MYLLVIITRQEDKTHEFLSLLSSIGVSGATVFEGKGMGKILQEKETVFTSLSRFSAGALT